MAHEGTASIEIKATRERLMQVVGEVEAYPDWMGAFRRAEVLESDSKGRPVRASFEVDARIKTLEYILQYSYPGDGIAWRSVEGNVKLIEGSYAFEQAGDGVTRVTYAYRIDPGFPVPGFLVRQGINMMVSSALKDLKERAEG